MSDIPTKADVERIMAWCDQKKIERGRTGLIEANPFIKEMPWTVRYSYIEVDKVRETAGKNNLVYDSLLKRLWHFSNNTWTWINPR